jgi:hypothetical protein
MYEIDMNTKIDNLNTDWLKNQENWKNSDGEIINIRSHIKEVAAVQLKSGSITLTDYLIKLNDEAQAIINKSIHHIEYLMDGAKIRTLLNRNNHGNSRNEKSKVKKSSDSGRCSWSRYLVSWQ